MQIKKNRNEKKSTCKCNKSHNIVLLSFPHEIRNEGSLGHHDTDNIPSEWPCKVARGRDALDLKSQILITGFLSFFLFNQKWIRL